VSDNSVGNAAVSSVLCQYEADPGPSPRGGKPFGLRTGGELRVCKPFGVGATVNQNSKWKFQVKGTRDPSFDS
jgi:hypothetical protein